MNAQDMDRLAANCLSGVSRRRLSLIAAGLVATLGISGTLPFKTDARKKKKKKGKKKLLPSAGCTPTCSGMRFCLNGVCTLGCGPGMVECPNEELCVELGKDHLNCGACGNQCADGNVCIDGVCQCVPPSVDISSIFGRSRPTPTIRLCAGTWDLPNPLELPSGLQVLVGAGKGDGGTTLRGPSMRRAVVNPRSSNCKLKNLRITHTTSDDRDTVYNEGTLSLENVAIEDAGFIAIRSLGRLSMDQCDVVRSNYSALSCGFDTKTQLSRSRISANGQGLTNYGDLTLQDCEVSDNHAPVERAITGGGIYHQFGELVLTGTTAIRGNTAEWGAGVANNSGTISVGAFCTISGNTATENGGGISNYEGTITLAAGAMITGNSAKNGGGIINRNGSITGDTSGVSSNTPDDFSEFDDATWSCV